MPEPSLLGDGKLIQMNQRNFFLLNPASSLFFMATPGDLPQVRCRLYSLPSNRILFEGDFILSLCPPCLRLFTRLTFPILIMRPNSSVEIQTKASLV